MGFFDILTKPRETMEALLPKANLNDAIKTYAIYSAVIGIILGLIVTLVFSVLGAALGTVFNQIPIFKFLIALGALALIVVPIVVIIMTLVASMVSYGILWLLAKLLGGTGTFTQNYFLASRLVWPLFVAGIVISILGLIPILGFLISIAFVIYEIYLIVTLLSVANKVSMLRGLVVLAIPIVILFVIIAVIVGAAIAAMIAGAGTY